MDADDALRPTLLIGLGGTGVRTLPLVKSELREWTERNGRGRDLPERWQFLCIDLPVAPYPADLHSVEGIALEPHEYLGLAASLPANPKRSAIVRTLAAIPGSEHDLADWLPDDKEPPVPNDHLRAAHVRAIGLLALPEIHNALTSALARTTDDASSEHTPLVILVGSLAGSTGSVLMRDVLETLGQIAPRAAYSAITIALTPECFPPEVGPTAYPRALSTLNELINLLWSGDDTDTPEGDDADRSRRGGLRRSLLPASHPVEEPFLGLVHFVGRRSISHWGHTSATTAAIVTSIVTDPDTQTNFFYAQADALRDYASDILAGAAATRLADGGSGSTNIPPDLRLPEVDQVELLTIASLMRPIAFEWSRVRNDAMRAQKFMLQGRARPLAESLPLPTAHLRAMIRGWFTGQVLGLLEASRGRGREGPWVRSAIVLDPLDEPQRATFVAGGPPQAVDTELDLLAAVLESFTFAQLEVSIGRSLASLNAYRALRDLGMSDPSAPEDLRYPKLAQVLAEWIETGVVHGGDILQDASLHPKLAAAEDPEARREALAGLFESMISDVENLRRKHIADEGPRPRHSREAPAWLSLDDHILASLRALVRASRAFDLHHFSM